jgi:predicted DNA-binding transcriptional regulator AlpA
MSRRPDRTPPDPQTLINPSVPDRLAYRLAELAKLLGISRRTLERERSAGRFPPPDLSIGKAPLWKPETIRRWVDGGGAR